MLSRQVFKRHAQARAYNITRLVYSFRHASYTATRFLNASTPFPTIQPTLLPTRPRTLTLSDDLKPPKGAPKPVKPKQEKKKREPPTPVPTKDDHPKKDSVVPSSPSSPSTAPPPTSSAPPAPPAPPNDNSSKPPRPSHTEKLYQFASAAEKQQIMILPINKRPLIPGTFLTLFT